MKTESINKVSDFGIIIFLILFPHFVPLPFYSYAVICFILIILFLKKKGKTLFDIGLKKRAFFKAILIGFISALIWIAVMRWIFVPTIKAFFDVPDYTEYNFIKGHLLNLCIIIIASWIVGGFYEEITFRGVMNFVIQKYFKNILLTIFITSSLFGVYHYQQGIFGIIAASLGGLYWNAIYYCFGRNLWNCIFSHAFFDTITLILIYFDLFGK